MKVFLSHSSVDKNLARRLSLDLQATNIDVWLDQWEIGVGTEFVQSIERGVDEAEFVIVLLTPGSVASDWVNREWRRKVQKEAGPNASPLCPSAGSSAKFQISWLSVAKSTFQAGATRWDLGTC